MTTKTIRCYGRVVTRSACQEWYETASRDAGRRARELRSLGFKVNVCGMGYQVTPVGQVKMTLVTIAHDGENIPPKIEVVR